MSGRSFNQPSLTDAFVKAYSRAGGFLEEISKTFDWSAFDVILRPGHSSGEEDPNRLSGPAARLVASSLLTPTNRIKSVLFANSRDQAMSCLSTRGNGSSRVLLSNRSAREGWCKFGSRTVIVVGS